jgi:hypothetical protein
MVLLKMGDEWLWLAYRSTLICIRAEQSRADELSMIILQCNKTMILLLVPSNSQVFSRTLGFEVGESVDDLDTLPVYLFVCFIHTPF